MMKIRRVSRHLYIFLPQVFFQDICCVSSQVGTGAFPVILWGTGRGNGRISRMIEAQKLPADDASVLLLKGMCQLLYLCVKGLLPLLVFGLMVAF